MYIRRIISVAAAAVSIGICACITYMSRDVDRSTLLFNLAFLAVMLIMILASYLIGLRRLITDCHSLKTAIRAIRDGVFQDPSRGNSQLPVFQNKFLDKNYQQYCRMIHLNETAPCDIQNFINEEVIEAHSHRSMLEIVPDLLTSLGILGTFVGLVMGLNGFDPSGFEQMTGSISPLINGIRVAFMTSIYGISLSLSFSFLLRSEYSNLSSLMDEFLDAYYLHVRPPYEVDSLSRLLDGQKTREDMTKELTTIFVDQMAKSFEQVIAPAYDRMTEGINHVVESFTESQAMIITQICESMIQQMQSELNEDFNQLSRTIQEIQKTQTSYNTFMDQTMGHIQNSLTALQRNIEQMDQYSSNSLKQLTSSHQEAQKIQAEQASTYQEYIRFMNDSIEKFSAVWEKYSAKIQSYSDNILRLGPVQSNKEILDCLDQISELMQDVQKRQISFSLNRELESDSSEEQKEMLNQALKKLDNLSTTVDTPWPFRGRRKK